MTFSRTTNQRKGHQMLVNVVTRSEFVERNGEMISWGDPRPNQRRWLFETGATMIEADLRDPEFHDPPTDDETRLELVLNYHELRVRETAAAFKQLKSVALGLQDGFRPGGFKWDETKWGPIPPERFELTGAPCAAAGLKRLKEIHDRHKAKVAEVEAQIAELPTVKLSQMQEELRAAEERRSKEYTERMLQQQGNKIREIHLDGFEPAAVPPDDELAVRREDMRELR